MLVLINLFDLIYFILDMIFFWSNFIRYDWCNITLKIEVNFGMFALDYFLKSFTTNEEVSTPSASSSSIKTLPWASFAT